MTTTLVSMSEIMRVAPWSLRALGYPFGTAERATRLLTWTEAVTGQGLRMLRLGEKQIAGSTAERRSSRSDEPGFGRVIDAAGQCLFDVGPPAIDLATCDMRTRGTAHVAIRGAIGLGMVEALCDLAVKRGLHVVIVYRSGGDEIAPEIFAGSGWIAGCPVRSQPFFLSGRLGDDGGNVLPGLHRTPLRLGETEERAIARDIDRVLTSEPDGPGYIGITTIAGAAAPRDPAAGAFPKPVGVGLRIMDYPERVARAYRLGVEVDTVDLEHLYALERLTWAPTSERSRKQAGY
jgi:hypothetical protein